MAKGRGNPEGTGKIKFRFVEFEMDGTDSSLEEGLKSIAAALNRGMNPAIGTKLLRHNGPEQAIARPDEEEAVVEEPNDEEEPATPSAPRKTAALRKVAPRKILDNFKLDDVKPTLKDFATTKNPNSDLKKYLVIAFWAKTYKNLEELTPDHFFTAYRALGWSTPKDPVQPIRDLVNPRNGRFSSGTAPGNGKINHIGEQVVIDMGGANE